MKIMMVIILDQLKSLLEEDPSATYSSIEVPNNATPLKIVENRLNRIK